MSSNETLFLLLNLFSFKVIQKDPVGIFTFDLKSKDYDDDPAEGGNN